MFGGGALGGYAGGRPEFVLVGYTGCPGGGPPGCGRGAGGEAQFVGRPGGPERLVGGGGAAIGGPG